MLHMPQNVICVRVVNTASRPAKKTSLYVITNVGTVNATNARSVRFCDGPGMCMAGLGYGFSPV